MLRNIPVLRGVRRPRQADRGRDPAAGLIGLGARHHAERDLAGAQRRDPGLPGDQLATWRQDRGHGHEVLLLDIGVAQRIFECGERVAMDAGAAGQKDALGDGKHWPSMCALMG